MTEQEQKPTHWIVVNPGPPPWDDKLYIWALPVFSGETNDEVAKRHAARDILHEGPFPTDQDALSWLQNNAVIDDTDPEGPKAVIGDLSAIDPNLELHKSGTLHMEELKNMVNDYLSTTVQGISSDSVVEIKWEVTPEAVKVNWRIYKDKKASEPAYKDEEAVAIAKRVIAENPDLVERAKARKPGTINHLVGEVMRALFASKKKLEPEKAFELVTNLLDISFNRDELANPPPNDKEPDVRDNT